jgi:hypothetical protein
MSTHKHTEEQQTIFFYTVKRPENLLIKARAGTGKCLGKDTNVLMFDGSVKRVQDINIGDQLMGDDSTPRNVLNTNIGYGKLCKIIPQKGDEWICNDIHIMTIHHEKQSKIINIPLNEINYPKYPNGNFRYARLLRTGVYFNEQKVNIDPYLLGLWLGDGTKVNGTPKLSIYVNDMEILSYLSKISYENIDPKFNEYKKNVVTVALTTDNHKNHQNVLRNEFKKCLNNNGSFSIPKNYLINSRENRLKLLAGIVDTDGYKGTNGYYVVITKYIEFGNDILFLARSLGYAAYITKRLGKIKEINFVGEYWAISLSGSFEELPCLLERKKSTNRKQIKSVLRTGFRYENIGDGEYYGFTLDGNGRFLLGDFTITHNTYVSTICASLLPKDASIMFLAYNKHVQMELTTKLPEHVRCYTTYGLGLAALLRKYKDIKFDQFKIDNIIRRKSKSWNLEDELKNDSKKIHTYKKSIKDLVNLCRVTLTTKSESIRFLANDHRLNLKKDTDIKRVLKVLDEASTDRKTYDQTDMIYLPAIDKSIWMFPQDYVFIDEFQDMNLCQIKIIEKILKKDKVTGKITGRLFSFGDPAQMIYKFNGVTNKTLEWFEKFPNTKVLTLTTSFRCAKNIIKKAQELVPDIKAMDDAPDGIVRYDGNVLIEAKEGDFVLCRTTAPLVKLFFELLSQDKKVMIKGSDIGLKMLDLIGNIDTIDNLIKHWQDELWQYKNDLYKEGILDVNDHADYVALKDKVNTLLFLAANCVNIYDLKHNPVSLVSDFSFVMSSVPMTQYNDTGLVIHESVFRKIGIGSVGLGFNIDGKYFFAGGRYRFGYCAGGYNNDPMPNIPEVVKNGQMNLRTNIYQSMEILLGAKYKNYQLVLRDAIPLTTPVVNNGGGYSGMIAVSLTLGYRF